MLLRGANFAAAVLPPDVDLRLLNMAEACFKDADLRRGAAIDGALIVGMDLSAAKVPPGWDLRGADISGCRFGRVNFSGAERRGGADARYTADEWRRHADRSGHIKIAGREKDWDGAAVVEAAHGGGALLLSGCCARGAG